MSDKDYKTQARLRAEEITAEIYKCCMCAEGWIEGINHFVLQRIEAAYEQGRQDVLARWPSEEETFAAASKYAHGDGESHENMFLAFVETVKWLRERLGV